MIVCGVFLVLIAVKILFVDSSAFGPLNTDEVWYWRYANSILETGSYQGAHYPPLYPVFLIPALPFTDVWSAMLGLNAIYSSALVFPAYALASALMDRRSALAATLVIAALPFHFVYTNIAMSENLFYPLLVLASYLVVAEPRAHPKLWHASTGAVLAGLMLTRFISIVLVPAFLVVWIIKQTKQLDSRNNKGLTVPLMILLGAMCLVYSPWVLMQFGNGGGLREVFGFAFSAGETDPSVLSQMGSVSRITLYAGMYSALFALIAAPVGGLVNRTLIDAVKTRFKGALGRLSLLIMLCSGGLFIAMTRHSVYATYNFPDPYKLMGRYAMPMGGLFVILGFAGLAKLWESRGSGCGQRLDSSQSARMTMRALVPPMAVAIGLTVLGYLRLVPFGSFMRTVGFATPQVYKFHESGVVYLAAVLLVIILPMLLVRLRRSTAVSAYAVAMIALSLIGMPAVFNSIEAVESYALHGAQIAQAYEAEGQPFSVRVYLSADVIEAGHNSENRMLGGTKDSAELHGIPRDNMLLASGDPGSPDEDRDRTWKILLATDEGYGNDQVLLRYAALGHEYVLVDVVDAGDTETH